MHRSKRNRARDFDARGRGTGRRFVLSYPIESSPDERTIYMVHRVESVSINTHDRRNEPGRLVFSSHPLPIYPCFHKNPRFQNFYSLPSIAPSLHLSFYISSIPRPARSTNLAPRGREFVRDSSKLPVRTFVEIRGRYTIKFPEAKNTNREYKRIPHVRPLYLSVRQINIILLSRSQDLDHVHDHARGQDYSRPIQLSARVSVLAKAAEADLETDPPVTVNVTCVLT